MTVEGAEDRLDMYLITPGSAVIIQKPLDKRLTALTCHQWCRVDIAHKNKSTVGIAHPTYILKIKQESSSIYQNQKISKL